MKHFRDRLERGSPEWQHDERRQKGESGENGPGGSGGDVLRGPATDCKKPHRRERIFRVVELHPANLQRPSKPGCSFVHTRRIQEQIGPSEPLRFAGDAPAGVCTIAQTFKGRAGRIVERDGSLFLQRAPMLLTISLLLTITGTVVLSRVLARGPVSSSDPGWMSERWLAEHRASSRV